MLSVGRSVLKNIEHETNPTKAQSLSQFLASSAGIDPLFGRQCGASVVGDALGPHAPPISYATHLLSNRATSFRTLPKGSDDRGKVVTHQTV